MLRLGLVAACLSLAAGIPSIPFFGAKTVSDLPKIVGGEDARPGEFPFQVSIQKQGFFGRSHICGGSVLNEHNVLTAAHCLAGAEAHSIYVVVGEYDLSKNSGDEQVIVSSKLVIHEHYDAETHTNDVGIINLVPSISFNDKVQAVTLPDQMGVVKPGTDCLAIGWGALAEDGSSSDILQKVTVPVVSDFDCREDYGITVIADHMLCAGYPEGGKDACQGDSGGPLVCGGVQHGITSWGYGCAQPDYPGIYTEVAFFADWINTHM